LRFAKLCTATAAVLPAGKAIAPIYEQLAKQYPGVKFLKVDIDNDGLMQVVQEHGITGVVSQQPAVVIVVVGTCCEQQQQQLAVGMGRTGGDFAWQW
jgi:thiol-disulfide isomerase/thioredoxin